MKIPPKKLMVKHAFLGETEILVSPKLPDCMEEVLRVNNHVTRGEYSVTEILDHPRCAAIKRLYPEMDLADVSKQVASTVGTAVHAYFEEHTKGRESGRYLYKEQQVMLPKGLVGADVSGSVDQIEYQQDSKGVWYTIIRDIKNWKCYRYMQLDFDSVIGQTMLYALAFSLANPKAPPVRWLQCAVLFTDWNRRDKAVRKDAYPDRPIITLNFRNPSRDVRIAYAKERVAAHLALRGVPEEKWPDADPYYIWESIESFKLYKPGQRRALPGGVFDPNKFGKDAKAAELACMKKQQELREQGTDTVLKCFRSPRRRCEGYCAQAEKCTTYQRYLANERRLQDADKAAG